MPEPSSDQQRARAVLLDGLVRRSYPPRVVRAASAVLHPSSQERPLRVLRLLALAVLADVQEMRA